ncbi:MAG: hypothetical protein ACK4UN_07840 [Limisphaerales bacterium]
MKSLLLLLPILVIAITGCATSTPSDQTARTAALRLHAHSKNAVKDLDIRSAVFGTGLHVADVTDKVIELLRSEQAGFLARGDVLGIDPLPYSPKCLVIDYYFKGTPYRYFVVNQQYVDYDLLIKNTKLQ